MLESPRAATRPHPIVKAVASQPGGMGMIPPRPQAQYLPPSNAASNAKPKLTMSSRANTLPHPHALKSAMANASQSDLKGVKPNAVKGVASSPAVIPHPHPQTTQNHVTVSWTAPPTHTPAETKHILTYTGATLPRPKRNKSRTTAAAAFAPPPGPQGVPAIPPPQAQGTQGPEPAPPPPPRKKRNHSRSSSLDLNLVFQGGKHSLLFSKKKMKRTQIFKTSLFRNFRTPYHFKSMMVILPYSDKQKQVTNYPNLRK